MASLDHNLESVEVGEGFSLVESIHFTESFSGLPLGIKIESLSGLLEGSGSSSSEDGKSKLGEVESLERISNSGEVAESVNENGVGINDVSNDDKLSVILSIIDVANSAWLNNVSESL